MNRDAQGYRIVRVRSLLAGAGVLFLAVLAIGFWKREAIIQESRVLALGKMELAAEKYGWQLAANADSVELFEIEELPKATNSVSIWIGPLREKHGYVGRRAISGHEAKAFLERWGKMRFHWGLSGLCHDPGFVLRFLKDGDAMLETTLCFKCDNFQIPTAMGPSMMGFDQESRAGQNFVRQVRSLFPDSPKWAALEIEMQKRQKDQE